MKLKNATVRWFDSKAGEGMIRLEDGSCIFCHFTAIEHPEMTSDNYAWPSDHDQVLFQKIMVNGARCQVQVFEDSHYKQVSKLILK